MKILNLTLFLVLQLILLRNKTSAILDIDLSGVDLQKFQYFRYPTQSPYDKSNNRHVIMATNKSQSFLGDGVNRGFAVINYVRSVLLGTPWLKQEQKIAFDPEAGKRNSPAFQRQFGYRGENLIDLLGRGYSTNHLVYYGAIDKNSI